MPSQPASSPPLGEVLTERSKAVEATSEVLKDSMSPEARARLTDEGIATAGAKLH